MSDKAIKETGDYEDPYLGLSERDSELKPCVHCGGEAYIYRIKPHKHYFCGLPDFDGAWYVECACGLVIANKTEQAAIDEWNNLTAEDVEDLKEFL